MKLFEETWVREATQRIAADEIFQKKGKNFKAIYQYVVKVAPDMGVNEEYRFAIKYPEAVEFWIGDHPKPDFVMTTSYQIMHEILDGRTNAIMAITTRKAFVAGSLPTLLRYSGAINRVVEIFQSISATADGQFSAIGPLQK